MSRAQLFAQPDFVAVCDPAPAGIGPVVVTGARGVLGTVLAARFLISQSVERFEDDILDYGALLRFLESTQPRSVFHFAAIVPTLEVAEDPGRAFAVNVAGTLNVVRAAAALKVQPWVLLASSSHVYAPSQAPLREGSQTNPSTLYGTTKLHAELVARALASASGVKLAIARIFSFSHATQKPPYLVPSIRQQLSSVADGDAVEILNGNSVRDISDAETVIDGLLALAKKRFDGTVNIGTGIGMTVLEIARHIADLDGRRLRLRAAQRDPITRLVADTSLYRQLMGQYSG